MEFFTDNPGIVVGVIGILIVLVTIKMELEAKTRRLKKSLKKREPR